MVRITSLENVNSLHSRTCNERAYAGRYTNLSQMPRHPSFGDVVNNPVHNDQSNANNDNQ